MPNCFHYISHILQFLGICLQLLQKVAISSQKSVSLSIRPSFYPHGTTQLPLSRFLWNFVLGIFKKNLSTKFKFGANWTNRHSQRRPLWIYVNTHLWEEYMNYYVLPFKRQVQYSQRSPLHWIKEWFVSLLWLQVHHKFSPSIVTILELSVNHCKPGPKIPRALQVFGV